MAELVVAAALLGVIAALAGGNAANHRVAKPASSAWNARALAIVTRLVGDVTSVQADVAPAASSSASVPGVTADIARLRIDLASARHLPAPPDKALAARWSSGLSDLDSVVSAAGGLLAAADAGVTVRQAALQRLNGALAEAGDALLHLVASVGP
jgi:hypothetical protein